MRLTFPVAITVIGILVRVVVAPYTADTYDDVTWLHASLAGYYGQHLYDRPGFSYPPIWGYLLHLLGFVVRLTGAGPKFFGVQNSSFSNAALTTGDFSDMVTSPIYNVLFKSILFVFDAATALVIYRLVRLLTRNPMRAQVAFGAWFLNPFVIFQSAVHGAADVLVGFSVISMIALLLYGRIFFAGVSWAFGIMTKLAPIVLIFQVGIALAKGAVLPRRSIRGRLIDLGRFGVGALLCAVVVIVPEAIFGSLPSAAHNLVARTQEGVVVGGLSVLGIRYFSPWSWILPWAFENSSTVLRATTIAQTLAILLWAVWSLVVVRRNAAFAVLVGVVGTLASFTLLSPVSNPQYVLWWLPVLVVVVFASKRGYVELTALSIAALTFSLAVLGPVALLGPLATYTNLLPATVVSDDVISWYTSPGRFVGATLGSDFFAPAVAVTIASMVSLFSLWIVTGLRQTQTPWHVSDN